MLNQFRLTPGTRRQYIGESRFPVVEYAEKSILKFELLSRHV
jgi:hypothetical protein